MSRSACSRTTFFPARCPPGCSLVCCGQQMTTLLPKASKPCTRTLRKLLPYAINRVTVGVEDRRSPGGDAPDDPQHGEKAASHVSLQCDPGFENDFNQHLNSCRPDPARLYPPAS